MATLEVLFQPLAGSPIAKSFKHKPLGLFYRIQTPIIVTLVMGEAEDIGVEVGWQILRVGDRDLTGLSFEAACRALWEGAKDLTESSMIRRQYPPDTASIANMILWWRPPAPSQAIEILQNIGYSAFGPKKWKDVPQPRISLQLARKHALAASEGDGARGWYDINGRLSSDEFTQDWLWVVPRRQMHLRRILRDPVRLELGRAYDQHFKTEGFAAAGQPPSTPAQLGIWLATLAGVINACQLSPALTAAILCFLEAPQMGKTNEALIRGQVYSGRPMPKLCVPEPMQRPDQFLEDSYLLLDDDDDDEMPSHPPTCRQDGSKLQFGYLHQFEQLSGHQIVKELI